MNYRSVSAEDCPYFGTRRYGGWKSAPRWKEARHSRASKHQPQPQIGGLVPDDYHAIGVRSLDPGTTNQAALERALAAAKKIEVCPTNVLNVTMEVTGLR